MTESQTVEPQTVEPQTDEPQVDPDRHLSGEVEALLLMAEEPMAASTLAQALEVPTPEVEEVLAELVRFYDETERGFELRHLGGGWRYYTRARHAEVITRYVLEGQQSKLSQAALETLAVVAYQQPISRSRISAVRGVNVDGVIRTLVARGLIDEAGTDVETGAIVFATTDHFLERIGVTTLDALPDLAPHLPEVDELEAELGELARAAELSVEETDQEANQEANQEMTEETNGAPSDPIGEPEDDEVDDE